MVVARKIGSRKFGIVLMACGIALLWSGLANAGAAGPVFSPMPTLRTGPEFAPLPNPRPEKVISQAMDECVAWDLACRLGLPASHTDFGRRGHGVDGGGDDRGGRSSR